MPRVPVHAVGDAPEHSREVLRGQQGTMGRLLNIHAEMAHAPVVLAAYQGIGKAITALGSFDAKTARQSRVMQLVADIWPEP